MKDNFSHSAECYSKYRPRYPSALFDFIYDHCHFFEQAWDVGTGNGQAATMLSRKFDRVYATDISTQQLNYAIKSSGIVYKNESAEDCSAPDQCFDLVVAAQSVHWFDLPKFYYQVNRCLKSGGCLALWVYENIIVNSEIDSVIKHLYEDVLGPYWDPERKIIEQRLQSITFPYNEISCPEFNINEPWDREQLIAYLSSWSAVRHFQKTNNRSPLVEVVKAIHSLWPEEQKINIQFPIYIRLGLKNT